ncbi:serine hydrolase domain-containing protein [Parenemella sanctibonifatiensis]|uniref:Serine hydrolase n=1 Tax=Parenemella sanctibonifatiensis TaxID=2016505 RepID=A0A255E1A5_9ACTN|nr:serine hydrolase domain-containing protein [Parenemella sanctibonifatiensis]OYN85347.1 serine hydrolase [Parenemella sanctibonifatiensis]
MAAPTPPQLRTDRVASTMDRAAERIGAGLTWAVLSVSPDSPDAEPAATLGAAGGLSADAIVRIASVTKPIVAAATLSLVESGELRLEDPISRYVPTWADRQVLRVRHGRLDDTVPASREVTVRDLLAMGFGLGYDMNAPADDALTRAADEAGVMSDWQPPAMTPQQWVEATAALPMAHQPGQGWLYQSSYDALAVVIEAATGRDLDVLVTERILAPLGMHDTGWTVKAADLCRVPAHGFPDERGTVTEACPEHDPALLHPPSFVSASTGLVSTVADLLRFAGMLMNEGFAHGVLPASGPVRVLSAESVRLLTTDTTTAATRTMGNGMLPPDHGWGMGVAIDAAGRYGWDGGTGASLWVDPQDRVAAVLLATVGMGGPDEPAYLTEFWRAVRG